MFDQDAQSRFNKNCADAAIGYTEAAMSFYGALVNQSIAFWSEAAKATTEPATRPNRTTAAAGQVAPSIPTAFWNPAAFWMSAFAAPTICGVPSAPTPLPTPFQMWWTMPFAAQPAAWPMAYQLMASGIPHNIAWPAAQANIATLDAVNTATQSLNQTWSSYRSDSGYAVAPGIQWGPLPVLAAAIPLIMMTLLPVLNAQALIFTV